MSELKFTCPECTQRIACDASYGGAELECPTCTAKIVVPSASGEPGACPGCGQALRPDTAICTACGFNLISGERLQTETPPTPALSLAARQAPEWKPPWHAQEQVHAEETKSGKPAGIDGMYEQLKSTAERVHSLPEFRQPRPGFLAGLQAFFVRGGRAIRLIFSEKELIVFSLLQWSAVAMAYYVWVNVLAWIPEESWRAAGESDDVSMVDVVFTLWSLLCIGLAAFPLGILSGCMGAVHFLNRQGEESTIARCLKIVMPHAFRLWVFHWIDAAYTCRQILERLPKKQEDDSPRRSRAASEALYYAWKLGTAGMMPGLVLGKGLFSAGKDSVRLVKNRFFDLALLRGGYSALCWVVGILAYVGSFYFFWMTGFFEKTQDAAQGVQIHLFFKLGGVPILVAVGVVLLFLRPLFVISVCDIYSEEMQERGESIQLVEAPGRGKAAILAFAITAVIVMVAGVVLKPLLASQGEALAASGAAERASSPAEAFDQFRKAVLENDYPEAFTHLTEDSQCQLLMIPVALLALEKAFPGDADRGQTVAAYRTMEQVVRKHGIVLDLGKLNEETFLSLKDRGKCYQDLVEALPNQDLGLRDMASANLTDLTTIEDTATARIDGQPLRFHRVDDVWLVDLASLKEDEEGAFDGRWVQESEIMREPMDGQSPDRVVPQARAEDSLLGTLFKQVISANAAPRDE